MTPRKVPDIKERNTKRQKIHEQFEAEFHQGLAKQLGEKQLRRLVQIRLQADAPASLSWPAIDEKLKLTAEQKTALVKVDRDLRADRFALMLKERPEVGNDPTKQTAFDQKLRDLTAKYTADAVNLLDDAQKKAWKDLTGDPFDLSKLGLGAFGKD